MTEKAKLFSPFPLFLILYLPLLTFVNVVITIFAFGEFPPHTQMRDVKSPFIQACTVFMLDIS
jgi:hypothetical protein